MATTLAGDGINFSDATRQNTLYTDRGKLLSITSYTTAGSYTWTKPAGCNYILVKVVGGGGGSAGYCESGGAGGYAERWMGVDSLSTVSVIVGAAGTAVTYYQPAISGGISTFGYHVTATGGYGANTSAAHNGGIGGLGNGGDINLYGGSGTGHANSISHGATGNGGSSYFGGGASQNRGAVNGKAGNGAPGSGAPGARTNDGATGAAGEAGAVIIWEYA